VGLPKVNWLGGQNTEYRTSADIRNTRDSSRCNVLAAAIAEGGVLSIPSGNSSQVLFNGEFPVGRVNPVLSLQANETIIAGLFQSSQIAVVAYTEGIPLVGLQKRRMVFLDAHR
jgi:hypothetical protein